MNIALQSESSCSEAGNGSTKGLALTLSSFPFKNNHMNESKSDNAAHTNIYFPSVHLLSFL